MRHLRPSLKLALGALGASLAACRAPSPADAPEPAARPEVRYYMIADA